MSENHNNRPKPLLKMNAISKTFSGVPVLHGVDFELLPGEIMALMGENGAGKSTLMKILCGVYSEWEGNIRIEEETQNFPGPKQAEAAGISIIYQELNLVPNLSVAENIFLGREPVRLGGFVDFQQMYKDSEEILKSLRFQQDVKTSLADLRVGHQQLVEIAKALSINAKILIMDEPTSALSESETQILLSVIRRLKAQGVSIIYISHRMAEVFEIADRITILRDGAKVGVAKTSEINRQELIQLMVGRSVDQFFVKDSIPGDEITLDVRNFSRKNEDSHQRNLVNDVSFEVKKGEILGIAGLLGAGRTELLEGLFGVAANDTSGTVMLNGEVLDISNPHEAIRAGLALITEDRKGNGLVMGMNILHNLSLAALEVIRKGGIFVSRSEEGQLADTYITDLSIDVNDLSLPIESLSGGNQQKILLAKWLATNPTVLLFDDPTRGIDVGAKHDIYILLSDLAKKGISIVMTSSELPELLTLCDRILVLREGETSALFEKHYATQEKIMEAAAPIT